MKLSYTLVLADFKAAFRLHRRQMFLRRLGIIVWPIVAIVCFVIALSTNVNSFLYSESIAIGFASLVLSIGLPILRFVNVRKCYRQHFPRTRTEQTTTSVIDEEGVLGIIPGVSENRYFWNGIVGFAQDERVTLFYVRRSAFAFFPTFIMTPAQRCELNDLVARQVVRKQK